MVLATFHFSSSTLLSSLSNDIIIYLPLTRYLYLGPTASNLASFTLVLLFFYFKNKIYSVRLNFELSCSYTFKM